MNNVDKVKKYLDEKYNVVQEEKESPESKQIKESFMLAKKIDDATKQKLITALDKIKKSGNDTVIIAKSDDSIEGLEIYWDKKALQYIIADVELLDGEVDSASNVATAKDAKSAVEKIAKLY